MAEDLRESHSYKKREESGTLDGSVMKMKGNVEDMETINEENMTTIDKQI